MKILRKDTAKFFVSGKVTEGILSPLLVEK